MNHGSSISVVNDVAWILYEAGYISFGRFGEGEYQSERLSHYMDWETEESPGSELEVASVLAGIIEDLWPLGA